MLICTPIRTTNHTTNRTPVGRSTSSFAPMQFLRALTVMLSIALLSACTTPGKPLSANQAQQNRDYAPNFGVSGSVNIHYQEQEQTQTVQLDYEWQQQGDHLQIDLSTALGQTVARIKQDPHGASLEQAKQATRYATDTEQLLYDSLGWSLPVRGLSAWLQGFDLSPSGLRVAFPVKDNYRTQSQGWQLHFVNWQELHQRALPRRIDLERNTEELGLIKIRISIKDELSQ